MARESCRWKPAGKNSIIGGADGGGAERGDSAHEPESRDNSPAVDPQSLVAEALDLNLFGGDDLFAGEARV